MIKLIAALLMLIDHTGAILVQCNIPQYKILRIIGRLSMPMFAYCIARGFYYSEKNKTLKKYFKNIIIFALISQIPFGLIWFSLTKKWDWMNFFHLNIGFTWLFSLIILKLITSMKQSFKSKDIFKILIIISIFVMSFFVDMDYKSYGFIFPIIFYFLMFKIYSPLLCFISNLFLYSYYCIIYKTPFFSSNTSQIVSIFSIFLIIFLNKYDNKIKLPKRFFYWFYPIHIAIFIIIKMFVIENINSYKIFF